MIRIKLDRPEKRNALNRETVARIRAELRAAAENPDARVVVLSGEGEDFCAGADLSELQRIRDASVLENFDDARALGEMFVEMRNHPLPIVAAVRGRAFAGGFGLATACDVILASENAQFCYTEVRLGFVPAMVMAILKRSLPEKIAFDLLTMARVLDAGQACALGLVMGVFPDELFDKEVDAYVDRLDQQSASAVRLTKYLLYHMDGMSFQAAIDAGAQVNAMARMTEDCRKGIDKFLKKN